MPRGKDDAEVGGVPGEEHLYQWLVLPFDRTRRRGVRSYYTCLHGQPYHDESDPLELWESYWRFEIVRMAIGAGAEAAKRMDFA